MAMAQKLRKRIGFLNNNGGFENTINFEKVLEAATQTNATTDTVMRILKELEEKGVSDIKDPTAYVTSALRKNKGQWAQWEMPMPMAVTTWAGDSGLDKQIRGYVGRLNKEHFDNSLGYREIIDAAGGDLHNALRVLKELEEKKDQVKDPTAYATNALRKSAGKFMGGGTGAAAMAMSPMWAASLMGDQSNLEKQVRGLVGRLNREHFDNGLGYREIMDAAQGDFTNALRVLEELEAKKDEVKDPTAYATHAIRKSAGKFMGGGGVVALPAFAPMLSANFMVDQSHLEKQVRGLVGRLNREHFDNGLGYREIMDASQGNFSNVLRVLEELEEKKDEVKDPTAYATHAIRKSAGKFMGGGAHKSMGGGKKGVKKTIAKQS